MASRTNALPTTTVRQCWRLSSIPSTYELAVADLTRQRRPQRDVARRRVSGYAVLARRAYANEPMSVAAGRRMGCDGPVWLSRGTGNMRAAGERLVRVSPTQLLLYCPGSNLRSRAQSELLSYVL